MARLFCGWMGVGATPSIPTPLDTLGPTTAQP